MKQALIFKLDGSEYAIESDDLIKIDRIPELTPLSYAHEAILGLCSTEGEIIPVYDALYLLTKERVDIKSQESRSLILLHEERLISLIVEEVIGNIDVLEDSVEYIDSSDDGIIGFMKYEDMVVQIVSLSYLIDKISITELERKEKRQASSNSVETLKSNSRVAKQYLVFNMGNEKFGIFLDTVREIIVPPKEKVSIANTPAEVLGLITLRQDVIPILDLRIHFKKEVIESEKSRILIVHSDGALVGLQVDSIDDIVKIHDNEIDEFSQKQKDEKVSGVAKQDSNLTTILSNNHLKVLSSKVRAYMQNEEHSDPASLKRDYENFDEVVIFKLSDEEFAMDVDDILEIVRYEGFTDVPDSKEYILGMINLRGEVIPVVSLMKKLGLQERSYEDGNILISRIDGSKVGFFVESVSDIVNIPHSLIKSNSDENNIFSDTILLDDGKRIILKMAIENLFLEEIEEISKEECI